LRKKDLPIYDGPHLCCAQCNKEFRQEDVIYHNEKNELIFCYNGQNIGCKSLFILKTGKALNFIPKIFRIPKEKLKPLRIEVFEELMNRLHGFEKPKEDTDVLP